MKPKQKYQLFIILCIILFVVVSTYKITTPFNFNYKKSNKLNYKTKRIILYKVVILNLTTSRKLPINYYAMGMKVDALKTMVMTFWYLNPTHEIEPSITKITETVDWKLFIQQQSSATNKNTKKITDLYLILSIIYDILGDSITKVLKNYQIMKLKN